MINIDKYIDAVLGKYAQTQEDFFNKSLRLEEIKKLVRSDFFDMDIDSYQRAENKLNNDEFELMEKWLSQHPTHFNRERKRVFNEWLTEYEKEKEINPFSEAFFITDNLNLIKIAIGDSPMWPIVKEYVTDWEQIDFKELASLAGKIDFSNYLETVDSKKELSDGISYNNKIRWTGEQNELITLFFDLQRVGLLKCSKTQLYRLINASFSDNDGKDFSISYIEKLFKPTNDNDRAKNRLDFSPFL